MISRLAKSPDLDPDDLSLEKAKAIFGPDFKVIYYDFDSCLGKGGSAPIFESKDGDLEFVVYAERGIVIYVGGKGADYISYLSKPLGTKTSRCQGKNANRP